MKVCPSCFNDFELATFIETNSKEKGLCLWCKTDNTPLINFKDVEEFFIEYLDIFIPDENGTPLKHLIHNDWNLFKIENEGEALLKEILNEIKSSCDSNMNVSYVDEIIECISYWDDLRENLKWSQRFLTNTAMMFELGWDGFFNKQTSLTAEEVLYRARIHNTEGQPAYNIENMGCPPKHNATSGRANPLGIPYLYLSKTPDTTFYETRSLYLDEVSIGSFRLKENESAVLVDFTEEISAFANLGNILQYTKSILLKKKISLDLSKPLRRYDSELEYIPTQFICEFIRYITNANGIIFKSSLHNEGVNVVIFDPERFECVSVEKYHVTRVDIQFTRL